MAFSFLKTGAASAQMAKAQKDAADRAREGNKLFRFWLKENEEARITFVDGELSKEGALAGLLDPPRYYEHNVKINGSWNNHFVCPEKTNPGTNDKCPLCERGERPSFVALFTVIDHRQQVSKDKSKTYKDTKRLFVAKPQTFELLTKHAIKRGGLAGTTWDASRVGDKAASVGSLFDFVEKHDVKELSKLYTYERTDPTTNQKVKVSNFTTADYEKEVIFRTGEELRKELDKLEHGDADVPFKKAVATGAADYSDNL